MTRPFRFEYPGAFWHVLNRGVEKRRIFFTHRDHLQFLEVLAAVVESYRWRVHAYVLMPNHFHLLVETVEATLSRGAKKLGADYAMSFNRLHDRVGPLFQGRFKALLIDGENYLLEVARYIVLNPVRANLVARPDRWEWSSYRATAGFAAPPEWLTTDAILDRFDPHDRDNGRASYRQFVGDAAADPVSPWKRLTAGSILGSRAFILDVQRRIESRHLRAGLRRDQRQPGRPSIDEVIAAFHAVTGRTPAKTDVIGRTACASICRAEAMASFAEIGAVVGLTSDGARRLVQRASRMAGAPRFDSLVEAIRMRIRNSEFRS